MLALGLISLLFGVGTTLAIIGGEDGSTLLQHGATTRSPSIKTMKEMQSANKHIFNLISCGEAFSVEPVYCKFKCLYGVGWGH